MGGLCGFDEIKWTCPATGQRQTDCFTSELRRRSVCVSHRIPPGFSVGALHFSGQVHESVQTGRDKFEMDARSGSILFYEQTALLRKRHKVIDARRNVDPPFSAGFGT